MVDKVNYADLAWTIEDVQSLFDVTDAEARDFLVRNQKHIRDRLVEHGWTVIETLGSMDNLKPLED